MSPSEVPPSSGPVGSLPWANDPTQIQGKPVPPAPSSHRICEDPSPGWERYWLRGSEAINPIVVKEVRQSLKSRQFTLSFGLTLLAAVSWTLIGTTLMVPRLYYLPAGLPFLTGFFCILALPLLIIVPFSAYRSLSAEMEHSTFELLKISALSALQIVYGKMASALVQTMLYLSALAPCIVLTYLLRGVSLWSILLLLGATVVISVVETAIAILLAAISNTRVLQSLISLVTLIAMICIFFSWVSFVVNTLGEYGEALTQSGSGSTLAILGALILIFATISLCLRAAAAAIDFPGENHATPLRWRILALVCLALFWSVLGMTALRIATPTDSLYMGAFFLFLFLGALMTGEHGVISPRAQRTLPVTFAGRVFKTCFQPGAGLGYIFIICLYASLVITLIAFEIYFDNNVAAFLTSGSSILPAHLLLCYLAIYLGINRLIMFALPQHLPGRMVGSVAVLLVVLIAVHISPLVIVYASNDYRDFDYAWHQAFNIPWSIQEASVNGLSPALLLNTSILTICAVAIFGLNLILSTRDVMLIRVAEPPRLRGPKQATLPAPDPFAP